MCPSRRARERGRRARPLHVHRALGAPPRPGDGGDLHERREPRGGEVAAEGPGASLPAIARPLRPKHRPRAAADPPRPASLSGADEAAQAPRRRPLLSKGQSPVKPFEQVMVYAGFLFYLYGTIFAFAAVRKGDARALARGRLGALIGAFDHALALFSFGARTGHFPVTNTFEAFLFLATVVSLLALILDWYRKLAVLVVGALPLAVATTALAITLSFAPEESGGRSVSSGWTIVHIFIALASYGAFAIAFVSGLLYLIEQRQLKEHASPSILGLLPSLEAVARVNLRAIAIGAALLAAGI